MRTLRQTTLAITAFLVFFFLTSGKFLIVDAPQRADVIVVLAGETDRRPARSLELLSQSYAPRVILDAESWLKIYNSTLLELAHNYAQQLPQKSIVAVCPIAGFSTKAETTDVAECLRELGNIHNILLVTSDYDTRRALSTFQHQLPGFRFSIAASYDSTEFGSPWWRHRQWAKVNLNEWLRLLWWEGVDRWI